MAGRAGGRLFYYRKARMVYRAVRFTDGWYVVIDGNKVAGPMTQKKARRLAKKWNREKE